MKVSYIGKCQLWTGAIGSHGYGMINDKLAHRLAYEAVHGQIPEGLVIDHLCRTPLCVNVDHLEVVTIAENVLRGESPPARNKRKTHCPKGHPYDEENTYVNPNTGYRLCRTCQREAQRRKRYWAK